MAFLTVTGEPGCRDADLARVAAQRLRWELVTEADLTQAIALEFGEAGRIPHRAWRPLAVSILLDLGTKGHAVVSASGAERLTEDLPGVLRFHVTAPESVRIRNLVRAFGLDREAARARLRKAAENEAAARKRRFGEKRSRPTDFDVILNEQHLDLDEMADLLESAVRSRGLPDSAPLSAPVAGEIRFRARLKLANFGIAPPQQAGIEAKGRHFGHPSEEVFANLLDFYGIAWDYEPRSFPLQWDKDGKVSEAFTPDFYLREFDLYVELTTMKQANVTKKNRKIRLLRAIYPHVNIQVFYQKDVQDLVMKYGLPERLAR